MQFGVLKVLEEKNVKDPFPLCLCELVKSEKSVMVCKLHAVEVLRNVIETYDTGFCVVFHP